MFENFTGGKYDDFMMFYGDVCDDPRDPIARKHAVMQKKNICFGGGKGSPPNPNPGMLASADAARDIAALQKQTADETLAFYKEQYADLKPLLQQMTQNEIAMQQANQKRADEYSNYERTTFRPLEKGIVADAQNFDTEAKREQLAGLAAADVNAAFSNARGQESRSLQRMGINPNSGRFAALSEQLTLGQAANLAGAKNQARSDAENMAFARKMDAAGLGRNLAGNASTAYGVSLAANQQARAGSMAPSSLMGAGFAGAQQGYGNATSSYGTAGNIYGQEFQGRMQGYQAQQAASGAMMQGLGSLAGTALGGWASGGFKNFSGVPIGKADGGAIRSRGLMLADGAHVGAGQVRGPGGPVDDKIPAMLSNGEYVLPADTTQAIGKEKLDKIVKETHTPAVVQRAQKKRKAIKGKK